MSAPLYTNLVRAKLEMNNGELPAMMGVPEGTVIDPAAVPGLGALTEDKEHGLLCPVMGCNKHFHRLTRHLNESHATIGGADAIKLILGIAPSTPLVSSSERKRYSVAMSNALKHHDHLEHVRHKAVRKANKASIRMKAWSQTKKSINYRNLRNTCDAQLKQVFEKAKEQFGRVPLEREMRTHYPKYRSAAIRRYGTYSNAIWEFFKVKTRPHATKKKVAA